MSILGPMLAVIIAALITRFRSPEKQRRRLAALFMLGSVAALAVITAGAVWVRGASLSSVALAGTASVLTGFALVSATSARLHRVRAVARDPMVSAPERHGFRVTWSTELGAAPAAGSVTVASLALVMMILPLQYAGAFLDDSLARRIAARVSFGNFRSLASIASIDVGQCLQERKPGRQNHTVPCSARHKSEVLAAVNPGEACARADLVKQRTYRVRLQRFGPFDGTDYCVINSLSPTRSWVERVESRLADTA